MRLKGIVILGSLGLLILPGLVSAQATCGDTLVCSGTYAMYIKAQTDTLGLWIRAQNKNAIQAYSKSKTALVAVSPNSNAARFITNGWYTYAVYATADYGNAIYGESIDYNGVMGKSTGAGIADNGVYGETNSTDSWEGGVKGYSSANNSVGVLGQSYDGVGVKGDTGRSDGNYGLYTDDNAYIGGKLDLGGVVDPVIGERFEVVPDEEVQVGDVMVIDEDSQFLTRCTEEYDTKVIGVIGPEIDVKDGETMIITFGNRAANPLPEKDGKTPERVIIKIKVDAKYGAIKRGDLLTTSPTAGHAMKAAPVDLEGIKMHRPGTIIGQALESLESGTGLIEVFVIRM